MSLINSFRTRHKLTQGELAELMGVTQGAVSHLEKDRRDFTIDTATKFQKVSEQYGEAFTLEEIFSTNRAA